MNWPAIILIGQFIPNQQKLNLNMVVLHCLPWINPENEDEAAKFLQDKYMLQFLLGHLELCGFQSHSWSICGAGI
jgi:hypothetical protein